MCLETGPEDSHRRCGSDMFRQTVSVVAAVPEVAAGCGMCACCTAGPVVH